MAETIRIGCRIPNGIKLEVGYTSFFNAGPQNRPVARYQRHAGYRHVFILGTRLHTREMRRAGFAVPSRQNAEPAFTTVDKEFWDQWKLLNPDSSLLTNGLIFEAKGGKADVVAAAKDATAQKPIFEPMDPTKTIKVGDEFVTVADFHQENMARADARAE